MFLGLISPEKVSFSPYSLVPDGKKAQLNQLITSIRLIPLEKDIDQAFNIAKTIEFSTDLEYQLFDIYNAYLQLINIESYKKAYEVVKYKDQHGIDIQQSLNNIINACIHLKTLKAIELGEEIFSSYPQFVSLSPHKVKFDKLKEEVQAKGYKSPASNAIIFSPTNGEEERRAKLYARYCLDRIYTSTTETKPSSTEKSAEVSVDVYTSTTETKPSSTKKSAESSDDEIFPIDDI